MIVRTGSLDGIGGGQASREVGAFNDGRAIFHRSALVPLFLLHEL
jgi:hypothetical protein